MRANDIEVTTAEDIIKVIKSSPKREALLVEKNHCILIHAPLMELDNDFLLLYDIERSMKRLREVCG